METDVKALLKDKRLWVGAAVAAGVGVVVFVKKGSSGGTGLGSASGPAGTYTQGAADTTGTDIASYLGAYQQSQTSLLNEWGQNLSDTLKAIAGAPASSALGNQFTQPVYDPGVPHTTGKLGDNASLGGLAKLYWGDEKYADRLRYANLEKINGANGNLAGLDLYVPYFDPSKA